jgi:hypothetical protein
VDVSANAARAAVAASARIAGAMSIAARWTRRVLLFASRCARESAEPEQRLSATRLRRSYARLRRLHEAERVGDWLRDRVSL